MAMTDPRPVKDIADYNLPRHANGLDVVERLQRVTGAALTKTNTLKHGPLAQRYGGWLIAWGARGRRLLEVFLAVVQRYLEPSSDPKRLLVNLV